MLLTTSARLSALASSSGLASAAARALTASVASVVHARPGASIAGVGLNTGIQWWRQKDASKSAPSLGSRVTHASIMCMTVTRRSTDAASAPHSVA